GPDFGNILKVFVIRASIAALPLPSSPSPGQITRASSAYRASAALTSPLSQARTNASPWAFASAASSAVTGAARQTRTIPIQALMTTSLSGPCGGPECAADQACASRESTTSLDAP